MKSIEQVWIERSVINANGKRVPTFWNPVPLPEIEGDNPDLELMAKLVALGLTLELPVGELVDRQMKRIPGLNEGIIEKVLKAAISDEARHDKGMRYGEEYLLKKGVVVDKEPAKSFLADIQKLPYHPISLASLLEVTCFLPFLALMRIRGGQAFNRLALGINEDEQRHVRVNASLAKALNEPISVLNKFIPIRDSILDYILGGDPDRDIIWKSSEELRIDGDSPTLNNLNQVNSIQFVAPFEVESSEKYSRTTSESF